VAPAPAPAEDEGLWTQDRLGGTGCADGRTDETEAWTNKRIRRRRRRATKDERQKDVEEELTMEPKNEAHMKDKRTECGADNAGPAAACGANQGDENRGVMWWEVL